MRLLKYFEKRCKELGINYNEEQMQPPEAKKLKLNENGLLDDSEDEVEEDIQKRR